LDLLANFEAKNRTEMRANLRYLRGMRSSVIMRECRTGNFLERPEAKRIR
jgi:hypothetical protein